MICTVSTVKDDLANVQRYVAGNLAGGADHLVIFLDAPDPEVEAWLAGQEHVTHVVTDDAWWGPRRPEELNERQRLNANLVKALLTVVPGVDWLFHIDGDEIVQIDRAVLDAVPADVVAVRLAPQEAVSRKHWEGSPTWFKRLLAPEDLSLLTVLGVIDKPTNGSYFHGHVEGKSGIRPVLDHWLTLHRVVDSERQQVEPYDDGRLALLHYESYSGEEFVRKWSTILSAGPMVSLRKVRQGTAEAVLALSGKPLSEELRAAYLMRIFEATTEDDFDTLRELGLLVEADPTAGTHVPQPLPPGTRDQLRDLLAAAGGRAKRPFRVCGPKDEVEQVLAKMGAGSRRRGGWRRR